jgi:hypothetical protein
LNDRLRHPRRWLSATLLAGLLVMATAGALFMYLADEIGEQAWLTQVDLAVAQLFHDHGNPRPCVLRPGLSQIAHPDLPPDGSNLTAAFHHLEVELTNYFAEKKAA